MRNLRWVESARHVVTFIQKALASAVKLFKLAFVIFLVDQPSFPVKPIREERMRRRQRIEHIHCRNYRVCAEINISLSMLGKARLKHPDPALRAAVVKGHYTHLQALVSTASAALVLAFLSHHAPDFLSELPSAALNAGFTLIMRSYYGTRAPLFTE